MRALVVFCAFILAACTCEMAGCFSGLIVRFDRSLLEVGPSYTVTACIDGGCLVMEQEVRHDGDPFEVSVPLGELQVGPEAHVTVDIRDENGNLVDEYTGDVAFTRNQPNGRWCEPTCWTGTVDRT